MKQKKEQICQTEFIYMLGHNDGEVLPILMEIGSEFSVIGNIYRVIECYLTDDSDLIEYHLGESGLGQLYIVVVCELVDWCLDISGELIAEDKLKSLIRDYKLKKLL
jgi:hypothetical protein